MVYTANVQSSASSSFDWLDRIARRFNGREEAYLALKAVLTTLRDVLPVETAVILSTRIPLLIRGVFFDGYEPARPPLRLRDADAFVGEVERRLSAESSADIVSIDAECAVDAVIALVADHLDPDAAIAVESSLPESLKDRWSHSVDVH